MRGAKYGVTRDYVMGLEGFLPTGEFVRWGADLRQQTSMEEQVVILGPVPVLARQPRSRHHRRLLVKGSDQDVLARRLRSAVEKMERQYRQKQITFVVDMDPVDSG